MLALRSLKCASSSVKFSASVRTFVQVGDEVKINFMKDSKPPLIKEDSAYPEWLFSVGLPGATKQQLLSKFDSEGVEAMSLDEKRRLKRLITKEKIKTNNLIASSEK